MELAVNMPEQEPAAGAGVCLESLRAAASVILPALSAPTPSKTLIRSTVRPSGILPARHRAAADEDGRDVAAQRRP